MSLNKTIVLDLGPPRALTSSGLDPLVEAITHAVGRGRKVIAVASAPLDRAAGDLASSEQLGPNADPHARAMLVAAGAIEASEKLTDTLAFATAVRTAEVDIRTLLPITRGHALDAQPRRLRAAAFARVLGAHDAVVLPGGIGLDDNARPTSLGESGSLLSSLFIADTLALPLRLRPRAGLESGLETIGGRKALLFARDHGLLIRQGAKATKLGQEERPGTIALGA